MFADCLTPDHTPIRHHHNVSGRATGDGRALSAAGGSRTPRRCRQAAWRPPPSRRGTRRSVSRCRARARNAAGCRCLARDCHSDSNSRPLRFRRQRRPGFVDFEHARAPARGADRTVMVAPGGLKSTALSTSLSSSCTIEIGRAVDDRAALDGALQANARCGKPDAIGRDGGGTPATRSKRCRSALWIASSTAWPRPSRRGWRSAGRCPRGRASR